MTTMPFCNAPPCLSAAALLSVAVYPDLPVGVILQDCGWLTLPKECTNAMLRRANRIFDLFVKPKLKGYSVDDKKRMLFACLFDAGRRAALDYRVVAYRRRKSKNNGKGDALTQVADAAVEVGLFRSVPSEKGGRELSRLVPTGPFFSALYGGDLCHFDSEPPITQYVELCKRRRGKAKNKPAVHIPFDPTEQFPAAVQELLDLVNRVNSEHVITCKRFVFSRRSPKEAGGPKPADRMYFLGMQQLRPVHVARFIDCWKYGGRLNTPTSFGHQNLRKMERGTIRFDGRETEELDYSGMHPRMLYHFEGLTFPDDPYRLGELESKYGGDKDAMRGLVKQVFLTAINAKSRRETIESLMNTSFVGEKQGKDRDDAFKMLDNLKAVGVSLGERGEFFHKVYAMLEEKHRPIRKYLSSDFGTTDLMPVEASIAREVMRHFAAQGKPILCVHDSFIVLTEHKQELCDAMHIFYRQHHRIPEWAEPVVKDRNGELVTPCAARVSAALTHNEREAA